MKAALNASARDAQIRDSFNKESFVAINDATLINVCAFLYNAQTQLPRNASKLHSLVVSGDDSCYLLNFEILRSVSLSLKGQDVIGFNSNEKKPITKKAKEIEEKEDVNNDN